jgi:hypothetical protein
MDTRVAARDVMSAPQRVAYQMENESRGLRSNGAERLIVLLIVLQGFAPRRC